MNIPEPLMKPVLNGLAVVSKRAGVLPAGTRASNWIAQVVLELIGSVLFGPLGPVTGPVPLVIGKAGGGVHGEAEQEDTAAANRKIVWENIVLVQKKYRK